MKTSYSLSPVWSTLVYFDLFRYPLTLNEIHSYIHFKPISKEEIESILKMLVDQQFCFQFGEYYSLQNDKSIITRRIAGNKLASTKWNTAIKKAAFINYFPFVRAVWISGSLSKNFMEPKSDIDYFIVTSKNNLWICRTILIIYKKIFLLNSHKNFCLNYFIDEDHLVIKDHNLFTATELLTLKPLINSRMFHEFLNANLWSKQFLPLQKNHTIERCIDKSPTIKSIIENMLSLFPLQTIDHFLMNQTCKYWMKKFKRLPPAQINSTIVSEKHQSTHHPQGYRFKVLKLYNENIILEPKLELTMDLEITS